MVRSIRYGTYNGHYPNDKDRVVTMMLLFDYKTINNPIASSLPAYSFWFPTVNPITNYVNQYFIEIFWTLKTLIPVILSVPILFLSGTQVVSSIIPTNLIAMALPASFTQTF
jgi:hypothetical protein